VGGQGQMTLQYCFYIRFFCGAEWKRANKEDLGESGEERFICILRAGSNQSPPSF